MDTGFGGIANGSDLGASSLGRSRRRKGEDAARFVAVLTLLDHPNGWRITPHQGDSGVDIKVPNRDGFDV